MILAKTIKGFGMGKSGEGLNSAHQQKKLGDEALREVRDRFNIQITDEELAGLTFQKAGRRQRGIAVPAGTPRRPRRDICRRAIRLRRPLVVPPLEAFQSRCSKAQADRDDDPPPWLPWCACSPPWSRTRTSAKHIVPIVPDEARTFGMEGMFRRDRHLFLGRTSFTRPRTPISSCSIARTSRGRFSRKASTRRAACVPGLAAATAYSRSPA